MSFFLMLSVEDLVASDYRIDDSCYDTDKCLYYCEYGVLPCVITSVLHMFKDTHHKENQASKAQNDLICQCIPCGTRRSVLCKSRESKVRAEVMICECSFESLSLSLVPAPSLMVLSREEKKCPVTCLDLIPLLASLDVL